MNITVNTPAAPSTRTRTMEAALMRAVILHPVQRHVRDAGQGYRASFRIAAAVNDAFAAAHHMHTWELLDAITDGAYSALTCW
jgi:hypothetical protein